jgi:hypothetical protein
MDSGVEMVLSSIRKKVLIIKEGMDKYGLDFSREVGLLDTLTRRGCYEKKKFDELERMIDFIEREPDNLEIVDEILKFLDLE